MTIQALIPQPSMNNKEAFREALRVLVLTLGEAFNSDGRVQINGTEFTVILNGWGRGDDDWYTDECSISVEPFFHEFFSSYMGRHKDCVLLSHQDVTINVDNTKTTWQLIPIGGSVFGQNRIKHQAGSPKPEPELIHPEEPGYYDAYEDCDGSFDEDD